MVHGRQDPRLTRKYKAQRLVVLNRDGWTCAYCGQDATTVDHIQSIKHGGDPINRSILFICSPFVKAEQLPNRVALPAFVVPV